MASRWRRTVNLSDHQSQSTFGLILRQARGSGINHPATWSLLPIIRQAEHERGWLPQSGFVVDLADGRSVPAASSRRAYADRREAR
jgi:hypothetical protein